MHCLWFPTQVNVDCDSLIFVPGHVVHWTDYRSLPLRRVRAENNWSATKQWNQNLKDNLLCYFKCSFKYDKIDIEFNSLCRKLEMHKGNVPFRNLVN